MLLREKINTDEDCFKLLMEGNSDAFYYLIRIYFPIFCNISARIITDADAAQDITHNVFIKVWESRKKFDDFESIKKYIYTSVKNASLNYLRKQQREKAKHELFALSHAEGAEADTGELVHAELMAAVRKAIDQLPVKMRQVFILSYVEQLSNEEVAAKLQISYQTVRNQKSRALFMLRGLLKNYSIAQIMAAVAAMAQFRHFN